MTTPLPQTEAAARSVLSLPLYPELTDADVAVVTQRHSGMGHLLSFLMRYYCTYFDRFYLLRALTLYRSLQGAADAIPAVGALL